MMWPPNAIATLRCQEQLSNQTRPDQTFFQAGAYNFQLISVIGEKAVRPMRQAATTKKHTLYSHPMQEVYK